MDEIADAAYRFERAVNAGERVVVGVNRYTDGDERSGGPPAHQRRRGGGPGRPASRRPAATGTRPPSTGPWPASSADAADPTVNLLPPMIDAVRARATEGEIVQALEAEFGTYTERAAV